MKLSGRNKITGTVISLRKDSIMTEVVIKNNDIEICGVITTMSAEALDIKTGDSITALIKATSVSFIK
jgi:molybdopterin-binding protein